jgi:hypothetical protein
MPSFPTPPRKLRDGEISPSANITSRAPVHPPGGEDEAHAALAEEAEDEVAAEAAAFAVTQAGTDQLADRRAQRLSRRRD